MKTGLIVILVIFLVLIVGGFFGYRYLSAPKLISENSLQVLSCSDTDGRDIYIKGYVNYKISAGLGTQDIDAPDFCEIHPKFGTVLREGWCEGNTYKEIRTTCGWGSNCVDNACE